MVLWIEPPDLYTYLTTTGSKFLFYAALCYAESALQIADCTMQHCRVVAVEPTGKELLRCLQSKERLWANYFFLVIKFVLRSVRATAVAVGINQTKEKDCSSAGWPQLISNLPTYPIPSVTEMAGVDKLEILVGKTHRNFWTPLQRESKLNRWIQTLLRNEYYQSWSLKNIFWK